MATSRTYQPKKLHVYYLYETDEREVAGCFFKNFQ